MKDLTTEEAAAITPQSKGKNTQIESMLLNLKPGEGLIVEKNTA